MYQTFIVAFIILGFKEKKIMNNKRFNNITIDSKHILPNPGGRFYSLEKLRRLY